MEIEIRRGRTGASGFLVEIIVFLVLFFGVFLLSGLLPESIVGPHDDVISIIALVVIVSGEVLVEYIMERIYGATQQLMVTFDEEQCMLRKGNREWSVPYSEITSVVKVMVINRFFDEKGAYRVTIKRKRHRSLTFWSTDREYQEHVDFEDTQLYTLYQELKSRGVKCC